MKIFRISQTIHDGWDTYSDAVVFANTEDEARHMHPDKSRTEAWPFVEIEGGRYSPNDWANDPSEVLVEYLGEAHPDFAQPLPRFEKGIISASYHAG